MKKIYITLFLGLMVGSTFSQSIDQAKMEKDLEVAKNVLATIMQKQASNRFFFRSSENVSAKYVDDYGVVFTIQNRFGQLTSSYGVAYSDAVKAYSDAAKVYSSGKGRVTITKRDKDHDMDEDETDAPVVIADAVAPEVIALENLGGKDEGSMKDAFIEFLKDYSTLIRQLKPSNKIMIKTSSRNSRGFGTLVISGVGRARAASNTSVEAVKRDLDDYTAGNINDTQLEAKLVIKESTTDVEKEPEVEVFSSILNRLYQSDMSDTYYVGNSPWYERTDGIGLTYYLKFYSSMEGDGFFYLPTIKKEKVDSKERNKLVNDMYPDFLDGFKENILEYGHLLKNLKNNETLTFAIDLTKCDNCEMPEEIEVSVKKSVIDQFRNEKLSLNQAKEKVKVSVVK